MGSEPGETLSAAAPHAQQQGVSTRLTQHARDPEQVFNSVHEEDDVQGGFTQLQRSVE